MASHVRNPIALDCLVIYVTCLSFLCTVITCGTICEPITLRMCQKIQYNMTRMPNLLDHSTQENANLAIEQFEELVNTSCSDVLTFFLCAMYAPICTYNFGPFGTDTIPPCKNVCLRAKAGCEPVMARYNVDWPEYLSCSSLPEYDKGVCISPEAIVNTMPEEEEVDVMSLDVDPTISGEMSSDDSSYTPTELWVEMESGSCDICPFDYSVSREVFFEKEYEYVIQATVESFMQYTAQEMYTTVTVVEVIKYSGLIIPEGEVQLWTRGDCACPPLEAGRLYLIMCYEDLDNLRLKLNDDCTAVVYNPKYNKRIKKWVNILFRRPEQDRRRRRSLRELKHLKLL